MDPSEKPWNRTRLDRKVARIPYMLTPEERRYLTWVTTEKYQGWGAIVDLGPWVGASCAALAAGLRKRRLDVKIQCYDIFKWCRDYMEQSLPENLPDGADFLYVFERETAAFARWLHAERMDLLNGKWDGGDIEILFVDAAKSWELNDAILRVFGPHLRPGHSRVIQQDFGHYYTYWLPLVIDSRPDIWQEAEAVLDGTMVTFIPRRPLYGDGGLPAKHCDSDFSLEAAQRIFNARETKASHHIRGWYKLGLLRKAMHSGAHELFEKTRREIEAMHDAPTAREALPLAIELGCGDLVREGDVLRSQKRPSDALALGERCLALNEHHWGGRWLVAVCCVELDEPERAEALFAGVVEECPVRGESAADKRIPLCRLYLADLRIRRQAFEGVTELVLDAIACLAPTDVDLLRWALALLERVWTASSDAAGCLAAIARLESSLAGNADFHLLKALVARATKSPELARESIDRALAIDPQHERARRLATEQT